jgi:beta-galactosidase
MKRCLLGVLFIICGALATGAPVAPPEASPRERLLMDFGWRFHLGNDWGIGQNLGKAGTGYGPASAAFSDASWRHVNLPHDWAIEVPFDQKADGAHGFRAVGAGFPENSVGWYRRTFELSQNDAGRRIWLEFDGVFRDSSVFVNGWFVGRHESGYSSFRYDITDVANANGKNVVTVKVDASNPEGWFYEGAGIYRHVWLVKTSPLAVAPDGVFVYSHFSDNVPAGSAEIHVETSLRNAEASPVEATVSTEIFDSAGQRVGSVPPATVAVGLHGADLSGLAKVEKPELWSPETPRLYKVVTTVTRKGETVDRVETEFGIRTVGFDAERGFLLNGKPYTIKGTCNHQDHAGVGAALPDALQYYRIARLKEMGGNAYRSSHNPPTPELLQACDRLGMLVMDENRLLGSDANNLDRWERLIRRDRNHASVVIWSIANEEFTVQSTAAGARVAKTMQTLVKQLDPTRPVTYAAPVGNEFAGVNEVIEVRGWNYHVAKDMDAYHAAHPAQPNVGTEQGSTVTTRGIYANDAKRGYMSAYDDNAPEWATTAKVWWSYFAERPWLSGGFVWTGFDYRGEPTPYGWPCINSHFGIMDTCGFAKDNFWYYQSWWSQAPVLHLLPHWNWAGREGQKIDVRALSNCDEVELALNGKSLGRQTMPRNGELKWNVAYEPGALVATGYNAGKAVAQAKVETTGMPVAVQLRADRPHYQADGEDLSVITVALVDAQGRISPLAGNDVTFTLEGPGRIIGVGNGDPSSHEADVFVSTPTIRTFAVNNWRMKKGVDLYAPNVPETAREFNDLAWEKADVQVASGPLGPMERAVFRGHLTVSADDLSANAVELWFGKIAGGGAVFLNGEKIGDSGDARSASVYEVKSKLHVGDNTVAVTIANWGDTAGLNQGVLLRLIDSSPAVTWHRSVFNGLAQIIVQSQKEPGEVRLTANSAGLKSNTLLIKTEPKAPRPVVAASAW